MPEFPAVGPAVHFPPIPVNKNDGPFMREEFLRWLQRQSVQFANLTVTGDIRSANWDGASPADLSAVDATATLGFYLDSSEGAAQFLGDVWLGNNLTLLSGGVIRTDDGANRVEIQGDGSNLQKVQFFSSGIDIPGHIAGGAGTAEVEINSGRPSTGRSGGFGISGAVSGAVPRIFVRGELWMVDDGSATDPVITSADDLNTGLFWTGTDDLAVAAGGTEVARFDATAGHNLQGLAWTTWDPTIPNLTLGTGGTKYGEWVRIGDVVFYRWGFKLGTGGSIGGLIRSDFPVAASSGITGMRPIGQAEILDANVSGRFTADVHHDQNNGGMRVWLHLASGTHASLVDCSGTAPMTWAVNDELHAQGWYRAA